MVIIRPNEIKNYNALPRLMANSGLKKADYDYQHIMQQKQLQNYTEMKEFNK